MNRRDFLNLSVGSVGGIMLSALPAGSGWAGTKRPNIILCMADDQGWGDTGYNGHKRLKTPHLDQFAKEGIVFDNFYSASPVCSPTRATCLTGRHHFRSGVADHSQAINPEEVTVADVLGKAGYATGLFGKWHLHGSRGLTFSKDQAPFMPDKLGFQEWFATPNNVHKVNPEGYWRNGQKSERQTGEDSKLVMDASLAFIKSCAKKRQPFMAYVWFHTPHTPHGSTEDFLQQYADISDDETRKYYAQLTALDEQMGRLRAALRSMGIADNTLLVYTSDNGPKAPGSTGPYPGKKGKVSEGGLRVPCIMEWPGRIKSAHRVKTPAVTTDFYATFLAAAGVKSTGPERTFDGENILPALKPGSGFKRSAPIRFHYRKRGATVSTEGKWLKQKEDSGYSAWFESIEADRQASLKVINPLVPEGGKRAH